MNASQKTKTVEQIIETIEAQWRALLDTRNELAKLDGKPLRAAQAEVDKATKLLESAVDILAGEEAL